MKIKSDEKIEVHQDAMKRAGEIWKGMSDKDKKKYETLAAKDKTRYEK